MKGFAISILVLCAVPAFGEGPVFQHKDPVAQQEFENVYKDIRGVSVTTSTGAYVLNQATLQSGATFFVSSGTANALTATTVNASSITATTRFIAPAGVVGQPSFTTSGSPKTGVYFPTTNQVGVTLNGTSGTVWDATLINLLIGGVSKVQMDSAQIYPATDNTYKLGVTGNRWSEVWAGNGTVQTSSSRLKKVIREIQVDDSTTTLVLLGAADISSDTFNAADAPNQIQVPRGIVFRWKVSSSTSAPNADVIGFLGDDLPQEAHALRSDGTRDPENFYTSAVVGIQSAAIRDLQRKNRRLLRRVKRLETLISEIQTQLGIAVPDPDPSASIP